jgi:hypothetical protein
MNCKVYYRTVTPAAGAVVWNTEHIHGEILSVHIKPTTSTTTYKCTLYGAKGLKVWESTQDSVGETGEIQNTIMNRVVNEVLQFNLNTCSADELFKVELRVKAYTILR